MHVIKLDLEKCLVLIDSKPIAVSEGFLVESIKKFCSPPIQTDEKKTQYRLLKKANACGSSADVVIELEKGRVSTVAFLFDRIEFFESSVLESKILKTCEKSLNTTFSSNHPSNAFLNFCKGGQAIFFYDPKQGDLSLNITFGPDLDKADLKNNI